VAPLQGRKIGSGHFSAYKPQALQEPAKKDVPILAEPLLENKSVVNLEEEETALQNMVDNSLQDNSFQDVEDYQYETNFSVVFGHMFEIVIDILNIVRHTYSEDGIQRTEDTRDMVKGVLKRYLALVRETSLLVELQKILPLDELEAAVEADDADRITQAILHSFNPALFVYVFNTLRSLVAPLGSLTHSLSESIDVSELREYIPNTPSLLDITYPIRYAVHQGLYLANYVLDIDNWYSMRSLAPEFGAVGSYAALAAVAMASVVAYDYLSTEEPSPVMQSRYRREAGEEVPSLIEDFAAKYEEKKPVKKSVPKKYKGDKKSTKN